MLTEIPKINLAAVRTNANMTRREWATAVGVGVSTIDNWENGRTEPSATQLRRMSELSGIPMDFIFAEQKS